MGFLLLFLIGFRSVLGEETASPMGAATQERVAELMQDALGPARRMAGKDSTNSAWKNSLRVEKDFREASSLMPERLDLRFCLASVLIGEAAQTNSPLLDLKMKEALEIYDAISLADTNSCFAPLLLAAYSRALGDFERSEENLKRLTRLDSARTRTYRETFARLDSFLEITPTLKMPVSSPGGERHAILILGAALETNGLAKPKLVTRLRQGLKLARAYPGSPIILTGGNQKNGVTEAYVMRLWLRRHGIPEKRLYMEDQARDTVGNALYSAAILERLAITDVTVVTSESHMRRGLADMAEACVQRGLNLFFANLAASDDVVIEPKAERIGTYRDALRISGLWSYPGIQR